MTSRSWTRGSGPTVLLVGSGQPGSDPALGACDGLHRTAQLHRVGLTYTWHRTSDTTGMQLPAGLPRKTVVPPCRARVPDGPTEAGSGPPRPHDARLVFFLTKARVATRVPSDRGAASASEHQEPFDSHRRRRPVSRSQAPARKIGEIHYENVQGCSCNQTVR